MTALLSEKIAVMGAIDPQLVDNTSVTSDWVPMENLGQVLAVLNVGATDITLDAKLQEATSAAGAGAADLTGKAITQFAATDDNKQALIGVRADEISSGFTHVALVVTVGDGVAGAYVSAVLLGGDARYRPADDLDVASVDEIVN